jgi:hypothetical protein
MSDGSNQWVSVSILIREYIALYHVTDEDEITRIHNFMMGELRLHNRYSIPRIHNGRWNGDYDVVPIM